MKKSDFEILKDTLNSIATAPINQMCCAKCDYFYETTQDWHTRYRCSDCGKEFGYGVDLNNIVCFHFRPKMCYAMPSLQQMLNWKLKNL